MIRYFNFLISLTGTGNVPETERTIFSKYISFYVQPAKTFDIKEPKSKKKYGLYIGMLDWSNVVFYYKSSDKFP